MYQALIFLHSFFRWLVVLSLLFATYRAAMGYISGKRFGNLDNIIRHSTATIAHIQLLIGIVLYYESPVIRYFWKNTATVLPDLNISFFALVHLLLMLTAITLITIGSALAKRRDTDKEKFRTMLIWFAIAFTLIFIAIPWPFSPLASRPFIR